MTPYKLSDGTRVFFVSGSVNPGYMVATPVTGKDAARPVISLKSCVTLSNATGEVNFADGKEINDPFIVQPISDECAAANN